MSIECGNTIAMRNLATMYRRKGDDLNMQKYYLMAIEKGDATAMNNLAVYYNDKKDYSNMTKYYLMAIENGDIVAMDNFAGYYCYRKDYDNMTKYYLMAIENGSTISAISLANYYVKKEEYFSAIKYYIIALNMGDYNPIDKIISLIKKDSLDIDCYIEMVEQLDYELYKRVVDHHVGLTLLYKIHRSKIDLLELPFKYSPDNEGFVQAKEDFILNLKKEAI
jgi:predicted DNA-binding WGR domain protein